MHVKEGTWDEREGAVRYTFPGEGEADVRKILSDLTGRGYDGGLSIEPHMAVVFHERDVKSEAEARFENYVEYGRRLMRLVEGMRTKAEH